MKNFILILLLFSFSAFAEGIRNKVQSILPSPIKELKVHSTKVAEAEKLLGRPHLVENEKYYWEMEGFKYALELKFKDGVLQSLHYTFPKNRPSLEVIGDINTKKLSPYPTSGKSAGRFLHLKQKEAEVIIDPISKTIRTVKLL